MKRERRPNMLPMRMRRRVRRKRLNLDKRGDAIRAVLLELARYRGPDPPADAAIRPADQADRRAQPAGGHVSPSAAGAAGVPAARGPGWRSSGAAGAAMSVRILTGDCRDVLRTLPDASVQCCVTSPPYYGLRDYGVDGQIGLEQSPDAYIAEMVAVFREVRRVLRGDGTLFLNLGDSYAANRPYQVSQSKHAGHSYGKSNATRVPVGIKPKDLIGIPWMVAFALRADGWWLRQDNIWAKRNCMPESVRDRTTRAHEYMFMLAKSERYYYDAAAIEEDGDIPAGTRAAKGSGARGAAKGVNGRPAEYFEYTGKRNKRTVWWVATQPFPEAHFATFPPDLIEPCILAGTSERGCCSACGAPWTRQTERSTSFGSGSGRSGRKPVGKGAGGPQTESGTYDIRMGPVVTTATTDWLPSCDCELRTSARGVVLDPFGGAGTTGLVADRLGRDAILIELNPEYAEMARRRLDKDAGMFAEVNAA
jgi:DNA modification methylase